MMEYETSEGSMQQPAGGRQQAAVARGNVNPF